MSTHVNAHANAHAHPHETNPRKEALTYAGILFALIIFTFITVGASYFDFGKLNVIVAVVIATIKATLVALVFMHLRHDKPINAIIFLIGVFMLGLLLISCYTDVLGARDPIMPSGFKVKVPKYGDAPMVAMPSGTGTMHEGGGPTGSNPSAPAPASGSAPPAGEKH